MALGSVAVAILAGKTVDSLFRLDSQLAPMLVVAMLPAVFLGASFYSPGPSMEAALPNKRLRILRATWFVTFTIFVVAACTAAVILSHPPEYVAVAGIQVIRNALLGLGITGIAVAILPQTLSWLPLTGFGMICWIFGSLDIEGTPAGWALPLYPYAAQVVAILAIGTWITGFTMYTFLDGAARP